MLEFIGGLIEFFLSPIWNLVGLVLGLVAAFVVWHLAESTSAQTELAALSFAAVYILCMVIGGKNDIRR